MHHPTSPTSALHTLWQHRELIFQMTRREVLDRYKGSIMGLLWSFLHPLFMLVVYTFVFSVVFKARWSSGGEESKAQFAIVLFVGMIVHGFLAEVLTRAPTLILNQVNYVKKVVFPLQILPVATVGAALFHTLTSTLALIAVLFVLAGHPPWTALLLPLVLAPLIVLSLGLAWLFAALGVFLRDINQSIGILTTTLLFVSPVFFPVSALPAQYQAVVMANPLTFIIEQSRAVLIWGQLPDWGGLAAYLAAALVLAWAGYAWFQLTRKGFADVL